VETQQIFFGLQLGGVVFWTANENAVAIAEVGAPGTIGIRWTGRTASHDAPLEEFPWRLSLGAFGEGF
jgi:hypothetical protein